MGEGTKVDKQLPEAGPSLLCMGVRRGESDEGEEDGPVHESLADPARRLRLDFKGNLRRSLV